MRKRLFHVIWVVMILQITPPVAHAQWTSEWTSGNLADTAASGWFGFRQTGTDWEYRFFVVDTVSFRVMSGEYSNAPQYTYTFNAAERLAGASMYSLGTDLTGDGIVEFYVLAAYGTTTDYRQAFKIFNITSGSILFQRDMPSYSYGYPTVWDADGDGVLECTFVRYDYPYTGNLVHEVYETGVAAPAQDRPPAPSDLRLGQNFPNPFNPVTRIEYVLARGGHVTLDVFNIMGQKLRRLADGAQAAGMHQVEWDGADDGGHPAASGVYLYRLDVDGATVEARRMQLIR